MSEEIKNKAIELNDEEIEKAAGGIIVNIDNSPHSWTYYICPHCGADVKYQEGESKPKCKCGYNPKTGKVDPPSGGTSGGTSLAVDIF